MIEISQQAPEEKVEETKSVSVNDIAEKVEEVRDLQVEAADLQARLKEVNGKVLGILNGELPDLMDQAGVKRLDIPESNGLPALNVTTRDFYRANIAASWDAEKKEEGYNYLRENGGADLIKARVEVFAEHIDDAIALHDELLAEGHTNMNVGQSVHSGSLGAWLREQHEQGLDVDLEKIGGFIGRQAVIKETN